jgi:threonine/homoserine/homoserine lactone efflux protein
MIGALCTGLLLGLSAGLAPGPLLALVLAQSLRHGAREGCKIALTPLLTDAPIIVLTLLVAVKLADLGRWLGYVSIVGGAFVLHLAWGSFRAGPLAAEPETVRPGSFRKGIVTNLLSPHPWLFWLTVGAATLAKAFMHSQLAAAAFLGGFYLMLVGSKIVVATLAARSRRFLAGRAYRLVLRSLAGLLAIFAVLLLREGWRLLQ